MYSDTELKKNRRELIEKSLRCSYITQYDIESDAFFGVVGFYYFENENGGKTITVNAK
ncbi:hypothetical protein PGB90_007251 [Kerria lacca]